MRVWENPDRCGDWRSNQLNISQTLEQYREKIHGEYSEEAAEQKKEELTKKERKLDQLRREISILENVELKGKKNGN